MLNIVGVRIRKLRERLGWTQADLGERVGVKQSTIAGYESTSPKSAREPDLAMLVKLSRTLGTSTSYLVGETDDPRPIIQPGQAAHNTDALYGPADLTPEDIRDLERAYLEIERRREERRRRKGSGGET